MIEHVIAALEPVTARIAILANRPEYERLGFPVFADGQTGIGPLEAIRTALANTVTSRVILVGCDLPFVTPDLFRLLLTIGEDHNLAVPVGADGKLEPLCAIYSTKVLPIVRLLIAQGERKISKLFERVPTRVVAFDELRNLDGSRLFFENINTPDDYSRACEILQPSRTQNP